MIEPEERPEFDESQVTNIAQSDVSTVNAELVRMHQAAAETINADEVELQQSAAGNVQANHVSAQQSALGMVNADGFAIRFNRRTFGRSVCGLDAFARTNAVQARIIV